MASAANTTVLVHGYGFDTRIWSPIELAFEGHHVFYMSLPGFELGFIGSSTETEAYTISELAKRYWHQLDENNVDRVNLVGHSMGGYVCLEMLATQPSRVLSLALVHSHVFADTEEKRASRSVAIEEIKSNGRTGFVKKFIPPLLADATKSAGIIDGLIERGLLYNDTAWYFGLAAIRDRKDQTENLRNFHLPVLMMMGEDDKAVPLNLGYQQASISERTTMHVYRGVGHLGMYENTAQMITDFIRFYADFAA